MASTPYIGRFAPSPSGPLHFGSLVAALASYLDARHHQGKWLVRMEDIDPPREIEGAKQWILDSLQAHGLDWDDEVMYQSQRLDHYQYLLELISDYTYRCRCGRQRLLELRGVYDSHCLHNPFTTDDNYSIRLNLDILTDKQLNTVEHFEDLFQGLQTQNLKQNVGDFILRRKDGLVAYQLAVVADDIAQGITHIIRGSDLLSSTPRQGYLTLILAQTLDMEIDLPTYGHIPIATNKLHQKLSKQHKATGIDDSLAFDNLCNALNFLNHPIADTLQFNGNTQRLLRYATDNWQRKKIPNKLSFVVDSAN